jgi:hypothetical protein
MVVAESRKKALKDLDWSILFRNAKMMAVHMQTLEKDQNGNLLPLAVIKGTGYGQYYSVIDKRPIQIPRKAQYFLLPWENPENPDDCYLYSHGMAASGVVLRIKKEEVQVLGLN